MLFTPQNPRLMQLGTGRDLHEAGVAAQPRYEILERRLLRQIEAMKKLRSSEREAVPA